MQIKTLFDTRKNIYRTIEPVITYNVSQEARLKAEITEYEVTESIEEQFERLLSKMQQAMDMGGENEVGVWVSGFYGSGKSSFTKYLGKALDPTAEIEGTRFLNYLQARLHKPQTRALLGTLASRFPAAVVLLDLASEMLAGATMEEVSTVLYYKVLQWAGYSQNLKVAYLERKFKKDGRYDEFRSLVRFSYQFEWEAIQNDPLVVEAILPEIAHEMYPQIYKTDSSFNTDAADIVRFENDRVKEMIEIVRETTGRDYIIFIIDEVGQYVSSRPNLILNLDGLAKNLKNIGNGKTWIIGTAQQTLTEDDPSATFNSAELYKLKDRFPIHIDLESSDIREICYRRLLEKSSEGEKVLGALFEKHGQELRFNTRLENARYYDADFDRTTFTNLYPFLPAHFDILLHLLGALAKSTGGIGLRSAIKVIQDILIKGNVGKIPVAEQETGWLATTVTLYDALELDISHAAPSIHKAVGKVQIRFPNGVLQQEIAKTVAILQILGNMPVTAENIASLTHPTISDTSRLETIENTIKEMVSDGFLPFGVKDGNLCFFSEKINDIEQERAQLALRGIETRRIRNEALREVFNPLPSARLHGTLSVTAGLKVVEGSTVSGLAGENETIQIMVEFVAAESYEDARNRCLDESRNRSAQHHIFLLGRNTPEIEEAVGEIYRCREIVQKYRNDPDQEVKDYCNGQTDRAKERVRDLEHQLKKILGQGSFIFSGQAMAIENLDHDFGEAAKKEMVSVAAQVFDRYNEAPVRAETNLAEKFLRVTNLRAITSDLDPLGLVQLVAGTPRINGDHKALMSIRDMIERNGAVEGKRLIEHFSDAPFGWSQDTLRYLVAALMVNGEIKLKISGREIKVINQHAIDALRNNNSFKTIGISLRDGQIPMEVLARAAQRLTELAGETILPLEQDISKTASKYFPQIQLKYSSLDSKLEELGLPGVKNIRELKEDLAKILETDGSDLPSRLGEEPSGLYERLKWAAAVNLAFDQGLEGTLRDLRTHWREIKSLPEAGIPGSLKQDVEEALQQINNRLEQDNFYAHSVDLRSGLMTVKNLVKMAVPKMEENLRGAVKKAQAELAALYDWNELTNEEKSQLFAQVEELTPMVSQDLNGLRQVLGLDYSIHSTLIDLKVRINSLANERRQARLIDGTKSSSERQSRISRDMTLPTRVTSSLQLEGMIMQLQELKQELGGYGEIELTLHLKD